MELSTDEIEQYVVANLVSDWAVWSQLQRLLYASLGAAEEGGEVAGAVKKMLRNGWQYDESARLKIAEELGDTLYYVVLAARELDYDLGDIAYMMNRKLEKRRGQVVPR